MPPQNLTRLMQQAVQFHQAGQFQQAEKLYRQICDADPRNADAIHYLGAMAVQLGKHDIAIEYLRYALSINPNFPQACYNLALAYMGKDDKPKTIEALQQALAMRPDYPEALFNLALTYHNLDRVDDAVDLFQKSLPRMAKMPALNPNFRPSDDLDRLDTDLHLTLTCQRDYARVYNALAISYRARGDAQESLAAFRKALEIRPDYSEAHSNLLFTMLFHANADPVSLAKEHALWQEHHAAPLAPAIAPHTNDPTPNRRLRIGYVSPDFTGHPVGRFMLPLLENHDHQQFEIFCYSNVTKPDGFTERIKKAADVYRSTLRLSHAQLAAGIRSDKIDVLVDLTMHTNENRLRTFARKPAPLQVTYLGYVGTTGLTAIDYRFSDPYLDPMNIDESLYSEKTLRLNSTYWCYQPLSFTPPENPLPTLTAGHITFGSLNSFTKITQPVLQTWAKILAVVPDSHILLICPIGRHRERVLAAFTAENVSPDRIEFIATVPLDEYFQLYHRVDIMLDPFPYGGGTTSCDSLYMGVPLISLTGISSMARAGVSILSTLGHPEFLATSPDHYVELAASLASDIPQLTHLRATLRNQMKSSPLMDAPRFARNIESLYRQIWQTWCETHPPIITPA